VTVRRQMVLLAALSAVLLVVMIGLPWAAGTVGKGDFIGYWSASRLLLERRDPFDADALWALQYATYPERGYLIYTWNPPWALVVLLPVALVPFHVAAKLWLIANLLVLAGAGGWLWFQVSGERYGRGLIIAVIASVLFPPSLAALAAGQIVPWVLAAAIAGFFNQWQGRRLAYAGAAMVVVALKPHVTFLLLAFSGWHSLRHRQGRFILGAAATLLGLLVALTLLYPGWPASYSNNLLGHSLIQWQTPTLGGALYSLWPVGWIRYVGLLSMLAVPWLARLWEKKDAPSVLSKLLLLSVALAPFGWSFDQVLLLPAILQMIFWRRVLARSTWLNLGLAALYVVPFAMRLSQFDEFSFVWVPWLTIGLYMWTARSVESARLREISAVPENAA